ncbi:MAG: glycosyltransferase N-terminal domain-containing protein [Pseudomonadota bacterium]
MVVLCFYQLILFFLLPLLMLVYLPYRVVIGKENYRRCFERFAFKLPPIKTANEVLWCHAASNGESLSLINFAKRWQFHNPDGVIIFTSQTLTSVNLISKNLPDAVHIMAPYDHVFIWRRFIKFYQPTLLVCGESELWPGMITASYQHGFEIWYLSARISDNSFKLWQWPILKQLMRTILSRINKIYPQSAADSIKLEKLLTKLEVKTKIGPRLNLKLAGGNAKEFKKCSKKIISANVLKQRPVWLVASTHKGEEELVVQAVRQLSAQMPELLTILVPRHPRRREEILAIIRAKQLTVAVRSAGEAIKSSTNIYLADTVGELMGFYQQFDLALVAGSLKAEIGGHNIIEAINSNCLPLVGPYNENFNYLIAPLAASGLIDQVATSSDIADRVSYWLNHKNQREQRLKQMQQWLETEQMQHQEVLAKLLSDLSNSKFQ